MSTETIETGDAIPEAMAEARPDDTSPMGREGDSEVAAEIDDSLSMDDAANEPPMVPPQSTTELADPTDAEVVGDIQVPLTFCVGESLIDIRRLESLTAGYTFELSTLVESAVSIKVFGQVIGHGQLVQIGDGLGVRLLDLNCHGTP